MKLLKSLKEHQSFALKALTLMVIAIYLFATAPEKLSDGDSAGAKIPVEVMFQILNTENSAVRAKWTEVVNEGKKHGLKFDEKWKDKDVEAGPLPALFLRDTAAHFPSTPSELRLFLGSDQPLVQENKFHGVQSEKLQEIRKTEKPQYFFDTETKSYTAMFPDYAVAESCVKCHNEHPNSPKRDWKLRDIMGATTWTYPKKFVTTDEILKNVSYLRSGVARTYEGYLRKTETFKLKPEVGTKWPIDGGPYLPDLNTFIDFVAMKNSQKSILEITKAVEATEKEEKGKK